MNFQDLNKAFSYPVPLPHVFGEAEAQVAMDYQGIVDVNKEGQLFLLPQREQVYPLQVDSQLTVTFIICAFSNALIVH